MDPERHEQVAEKLSRRQFLGTASATIAAVAVAGFSSAQAQSQSNTRDAEKDHSFSDPGPENKVLKGLNPNTFTPPPTDHGEVVPLWYSFDLAQKRVQRGGWVQQVNQQQLPPSKFLAGVNMRLEAGAIRELHWHTADEWAYVLYGKARITLMNPDGSTFVGDVSEGDLWVFPAGMPHSIQGMGPDGTQFLLVFNQGDFDDSGTFLLGEWVTHTPREVLAKNFRVDPAELSTIPTKELYIFPNQVPTNSVKQDKASFADGEGTWDAQVTFNLAGMKPNLANEHGEVRVVDTRNFPLSNHIVGALVRIKPGGIREMHWHPNAAEWQYWIAGQGRMTVYVAPQNARTMDFHANDVGYVPIQAGHYIENTGDTDVVFLELFAASEYKDVSLNNWLRHLPPELVKAHLGFNKATLDKIPQGKELLM